MHLESHTVADVMGRFTGFTYGSGMTGHLDFEAVLTAITESVTLTKSVAFTEPVTLAEPLSLTKPVAVT